MRESFIEFDINPNDQGHIESMFALGNGYLGLRGTYDESDEQLGEECGMYINEIFEKEPYHRIVNLKGFAKANQYTVNLPDWRIIEVYIDDEKACYSNGNIKEHKRVLDFNGGKIDRSFVYETKSGKKAVVKSTRVVSMPRPHSAFIRYSVTPINFDGEIRIESRVVKNTGINGHVATHTKEEKIREKGIAIVSEVNLSKLKAACVIGHKLPIGSAIEIVNTEDCFNLKVTVLGKQNEEKTIEKYASFYSDADRVSDILAEAEKTLSIDMECDFDMLLAEQKSYWDKVWENGDVIIKGNDKDSQAVKFSLFHLRQQLPEINNASIGATGITGANYSGKVFWDTEMYLMPFYNYTEPEKCKGLLMYRYKILDKARERAKEMGSIGALYSWCSIDGEETSVVFEASTAEYHINSDIAYAIKRYQTITNDNDFIYNYCAEILFETAKFMAHRGKFIEEYGGRFCINAVCGPDEYACGVNNNCYTNFMVQFHLRYALEVYKDMQKNAPGKLQELVSTVGLDPEELDLWKNAADKMYYRKNEKLGIYEQDDSFIYNDPVDMNTIPRNYDIREMFHPLDLWRMQVLKQADVVLLNFVLGDKFTLEEKKKNYDYYEPKTNHGSSLSPAVHSIMANEIGYFDMAYDFFKHTAYMDIDDFKKNTHGGLHLACLGSVWMCMVNGFLGMRDYSGMLEFKPNIPKAWTEYSCKLFYKSSRIKLTVTKKQLKVELLEGDGISFKINDVLYALDKNDNRRVVEL